MTDRLFYGYDMHDNPDRELIAEAVRAGLTDVPVRSNPVFEDLATRILSAAPGRVTLRFAVHERARQSEGIVHGGVILTMLDGAMAFAVLSRLATGESTATISLTANFLGAARQGDCDVEAYVERLGKRIAFARASLVSEGKVVATSTGILAVRRQDV
jgi:uncharacterized protein (TIGR00369 family)